MGAAGPSSLGMAEVGTADAGSAEGVAAVSCSTGAGGRAVLVAPEQELEAAATASSAMMIRSVPMLFADDSTAR